LRIMDEEKLDRIAPGYKVFLNIIVKNKKGTEDVCNAIKFVADIYRNRDIVKKLFPESSAKCY